MLRTLISDRMISRFMRDSELRRQMGVRALQGVSDRSVSAVVEGLIGWYQRGQRNRRALSSVAFLLRGAFLLGTTSFSVLCFETYSILVRFIS